MLKPSHFAVFALLGAIAASPVYAQDKSAALVNGVSIPQSRVDVYVREITTSRNQPDTPELRAAVRDKLIELEILSQEASKAGMDKNSETQQKIEQVKQAMLVQIDLSRQNILAGSLVQDYVKNHPISDDMLKQAYDNWKQQRGTKEYKARHILVKEEAEAKDIVAQLNKGAKFDKLAKEKSLDTGSRERGGDLGWSVPSTFVKPFADALGSLAKGKTSVPVQSQFGWHIIKVEDIRNLQVPSFEESKQELTQMLQQQAIGKMIAELRAKAKVE